MAYGSVFLAGLPLTVLPSLLGFPRDVNVSPSCDGRQELIVSGRQMVRFDAEKKKLSKSLFHLRGENFFLFEFAKVGGG